MSDLGILWQGLGTLWPYVLVILFILFLIFLILVGRVLLWWWGRKQRRQEEWEIEVQRRELRKREMELLGSPEGEKSHESDEEKPEKSDKGHLGQAEKPQ
jgi:hypothetical protein